MTTLVKISELFEVIYGTNLVLNKLEKCSKSDCNSINFVSRTDYNNGVSAFVKMMDDVIKGISIGISEDVFLEPMTPAMRAGSNTLPFLTLFS